jgi:hypothetical protein
MYELMSEFKTTFESLYEADVKSIEEFKSILKKIEELNSRLRKLTS